MYTKENLEKLNENELINIFAQLGLVVEANMSKDQMITKILEVQAQGNNNTSNSQVNNHGQQNYPGQPPYQQGQIPQQPYQGQQPYPGQLPYQQGQTPQQPYSGQPYQGQQPLPTEAINFDGKKPNKIGRIGAMITVFLAMALIIVSIVFMIEFWISGYFWWGTLFIVPMMWNYVSAQENIAYMNGKNNKMVAGVLGIFSSIIGGILVLISTRE